MIPSPGAAAVPGSRSRGSGPGQQVAGPAAGFGQRVRQLVRGELGSCGARGCGGPARPRRPACGRRRGPRPGPTRTAPRPARPRSARANHRPRPPQRRGDGQAAQARQRIEGHPGTEPGRRAGGLAREDPRRAGLARPAAPSPPPRRPAAHPPPPPGLGRLARGSGGLELPVVRPRPRGRPRPAHRAAAGMPHVPRRPSGHGPARRMIFVPPGEGRTRDNGHGPPPVQEGVCFIEHLTSYPW